MGMVHNEVGEFIGIITAADVLEALVGAFDRASRRI
jgi:CBS domain containing-hemolysin-like protein